MPMMIVWGAVSLVMLVIEALTAGLATLWFAIGGICAFIACVLGAPVWLQIAWFLIISIATLVLTRPLVKKYINAKTQPTNADRVVGQTCKVTETIDNLTGSGTVFADGKTWTARSLNGEILENGSIVRVEAIQGVKLIVSPCKK